MRKYLYVCSSFIALNLLSTSLVANASPSKIELAKFNSLYPNIEKLGRNTNNIKVSAKPMARAMTKTMMLRNNPIVTTSQIINISNSPLNEGYVSSSFGMRKDPINGHRRMHNGIDIASPIGSKVNPIGKGKVTFSGHKSGFGKMVEIRHSKTVVTRYAHLNKFLVDEGQLVSPSDTIGLVGNSGRSTGPHLHLEVLLNDKQVDPKIFLANNIKGRSYLKSKKPFNFIPDVKPRSLRTYRELSIHNEMINRDSMYASADGYGIISNINKLDYEDYVKTLNGIYGFSAPRSFR